MAVVDYDGELILYFDNNFTPSTTTKRLYNLATLNEGAEIYIYNTNNEEINITDSIKNLVYEGILENCKLYFYWSNGYYEFGLMDYDGMEITIIKYQDNKFRYIPDNIIVNALYFIGTSSVDEQFLNEELSPYIGNLKTLPTKPVITKLAPFLTNIANAIRTKKGTTAQINAQDFASEIESIESGGGVAVGEIVLEGIEKVDTLPELTEENFNKGKIYLHERELKYIDERYSDGNIVLDGYIHTSVLLTYLGYYDNKIYYNYDYIGGSNIHYNDLYFYDLITKTTTKVEGRLYGAYAIVGGKLYVYGSNGLYICNDPNSISNANHCSHTCDPRYNPSIAVVGTNIYIIGGQASQDTATTATNTILRVNTESHSCSQVAQLPTNLRRSTASVVGTDIYIIGGSDGTNNLDTILKFDATTNTLETLSVKLPYAIRNLCSASVGPDIYIMGGSDTSGKNLDTIYKFNTITETLTLLSTKLSNFTWGASAITINNEIYIVGGSDSSGFSTIYKLSFEAELVYKTIPTTE